MEGIMVRRGDGRAGEERERGRRGRGRGSFNFNNAHLALMHANKHLICLRELL